MLAVRTQVRTQLRHFSYRRIPKEPTWIPVDESKLPKPPELDEKLVEHLERLSFVKFSNQAAKDHLQKAIRYASQLSLVNTAGVEPMERVHQTQSCFLREDEVTEGNCKEDVLRNAPETFEDFYVSPPTAAIRTRRGVEKRKKPAEHRQTMRSLGNDENEEGKWNRRF